MSAVAPIPKDKRGDMGDSSTFSVLCYRILLVSLCI